MFIVQNNSERILGLGVKIFREILRETPGTLNYDS